MQCLILATLGSPDQDKRFDELMRSTTSVLYGGLAPEISVLGSFARAGRGRASDELVYASTLKFGDKPAAGDTAESIAQHLENVLRSMVMASSLSGCDVRVLGAIS